MPLSLTYTHGVLRDDEIASLGKLITDVFLKWHGLTGNAVMTPNVTMQIQSLPEERSLSGGEPFSGVWLECKVPQFALAARSVQEGFFSEATDLIEAATRGTVSRDRIFANAVHTVDGTWNMDGQPLTNAQLGEAIASAAMATA